MFMAALPLVANLLLYLWKTDILKDEGLSEIVETVTQVPTYHTLNWGKVVLKNDNTKR